MNAEQLNLTWIDFAKQIGGVHRKFAQEKAQLVCAALEKMKEETGVAPTVDFYTSKCVDPDTVQTHFYWVPQINGDDIQTATIESIEDFFDYLTGVQNIKFPDGAKSVVMLREAIQQFEGAIAPGAGCVVLATNEHTKVEITVDIGGMSIQV